MFANGDVATFENDPLAGSSACAYVKGTAKNRSGKLLSDTGVGGVGGGGQGVPVGIVSGNTSSSWYKQGEAWLVCSYAGGALQGCYVTYVTP